jgi:hypothetical protein
MPSHTFAAKKLKIPFFKGFEDIFGKALIGLEIGWAFGFAPSMAAIQGSGDGHANDQDDFGAIGRC